METDREEDATEGYPRGHYVYLYRDRAGRVRYVGYGARASRAAQHQSKTHNRALEALIATGKYSVEIAGPFGSEDAGRAVETALVAVLRPECNIDPGQTRWRFRPLGVPERFAERLLLEPLNREALLEKNTALPLLFVHISEKRFDDGRVGYTPERPPNDPQILARIEKYWLLGKRADHWKLHPEDSPRTLVGVSGKPGAQIIIGALEIANDRWNIAERDGAYVVVPTKGPRNLDAHELRGRRVSADASIRFGSWHQQFFVIFDRKGKVSGGLSSTGRRDRRPNQ